MMADGATEKKEREVRDELTYSASRVSDLARVVGFGLASLFIFFSTSSSEFATEVMRRYSNWILMLTLIGCVIIFLEYFQNICAYVLSVHAYRNIDLPRTEPWFDSLLARIQRRTFYVKQIVALVGVACLGALVVSMANWKPPPRPVAKDFEPSHTTQTLIEHVGTSTIGLKKN